MARGIPRIGHPADSDTALGSDGTLDTVQRLRKKGTFSEAINMPRDKQI
jgi:hypothetical protein